MIGYTVARRSMNVDASGIADEIKAPIGRALCMTCAVRMKWPSGWSSANSEVGSILLRAMSYIGSNYLACESKVSGGLKVLLLR